MNIMIVGAGKMGSLIEETAKKQNMNVVLKADKLTYPDLSSFTEPVDAVIDFSHPDNLDWVYDFILSKGCAYICGTTGFTDEQSRLDYRLY